MHYKILAIDDEKQNLDLIEAYLEDKEENYEIISAYDGVEGWELLEKKQDEIDLILLDRMMPHLNGMEFMERINADPKLIKIPVIMQTASAERTQILQGIEAGVYYYLTKPYSEEVFISIVKAALENFYKYCDLRAEISDETSHFGKIEHKEWDIRTLDDCKEISKKVATFFPNPKRVILGLIELFTNAVEHGNLGITYEEKGELLKSGQWIDEINTRLNLEQYKNKKVRVTYKSDKDCIRVNIKDEGKGFDYDQFLNIDPERADEKHGRGIALANVMCFDELHYIGCGNEVECVVYS